VWTVRDVVKLADEVTGTNVVSDLYERHAARGERIDLDALMASLGVPQDGQSIDDESRLAWIRRAIVYGTTTGALARKR
jgi:hypothetical protein